jgi:hypothetical protein
VDRNNVQKSHRSGFLLKNAMVPMGWYRPAFLVGRHLTIIQFFVNYGMQRSTCGNHKKMQFPLATFQARKFE